MIQLLKKSVFARVGLCCVLCCVCCGCVGPSDSTLTHRFQQNQKDFETIVAMSNEDARLIRIAPTFTRLDDDWSWPRPQAKWGLTPKRWDEYRGLFTKIGLSGGMYRSQHGKQLFLVAYSSGMMGRGVSLGYAYCGESIPGNPDSLPPCMDHKESYDGDKYRYQKIAANWSIFEEH